MIGRLPGAREMTGLAFEHLYDQEMVWVAHRGHPMAHDARSALAESPVILPP
jgi:LysR family pca operon transcriptional activator